MISALRKLNGWQRLWVLASIVWLMAVGYYSATNYPGARPTFERIGRASCILGDLYGRDAKRAIEQVLPQLASLDENSPRNCKELFQRIAESGRASQVQEVYGKFLAETRTAFFSRAVAYWVGPVVLAYLMGIAIAWVVRGFRRRAEPGGR
jgi:hypothetical protein